VSTNNLAHDNKGNNWITWETAGKIYTAKLKDKKIKPILVREAQQKIRQKHPVMAINNNEYKLIAWTEGNGYFSGGELKLQIVDSDSQVIDSPSTKGMHPAQFSSVAVSSIADDSFLVLY
jgi:hypothetical protein